MRCSLSVPLIVLLAFVAAHVNAEDQPAVGSKAPDFSLVDQHGKSRSLAELVKQDNVALVFHRSANW